MRRARKFPALCWDGWRGDENWPWWGFWFRVFGYGLSFGNAPPMFSERHRALLGRRDCIRAFGVRVEWLSGRSFHLDHMLPVVLGGTNEKGNLQILCRTCNLRKGRSHPAEFAQREGRLL